jgi:teichuronic acid biosynthesis glycosyltransferase TuaC
MRILCVTNMYPSNERPGYGAFVFQQVEQLRKIGHVVDVLSIQGFKSKASYLKAAWQIMRATSNTRYDIVHAHYGYSAFSALIRRHAPLVITLHGSDVLGGIIERVLTKGIIRFADAVIVVSEEMRRRVPGVVIPCGVDLTLFRPLNRDEARARLGWPKDRRIILFPFDPARPVKRYDLAIAAVARLVHQGVDAELVVVFNVANCEMPWFYSAADAMLLCSDREGSPTSVKEALACNLPVVATNVGDISALLGGVAGTRICSQEVEALAHGLRYVVEATRREKFKGRAAMSRYDQGVTIQRVVEVYNETLRRFSARTPKSPARGIQRLLRD